jgi:hypothetical protein
VSPGCIFPKPPGESGLHNFVVQNPPARQDSKIAAQIGLGDQSYFDWRFKSGSVKLHPNIAVAALVMPAGLVRLK